MKFGAGQLQLKLFHTKKKTKKKRQVKECVSLTQLEDKPKLIIKPPMTK